MMQPDDLMRSVDPKPLSSWKDFLKEVSSLFEERDSKLQRHNDARQAELASEEKTGKSDVQLTRRRIETTPGTHLLFRGHRTEEWNLETTLERAFPKREFSLFDIFDYSLRTWNQLGMGDRLEFIQEAQFPKEAADIDKWCGTELWTIPYFEALTTLRHMGVPSPLLDWTHCPFVAAYFAFCDANKNDSTPVAVFVFQERTGLFQEHHPEGSLKQVHPLVRSHERHTRQQGAYTFCVKNADANDQSVSLCEHEQYLVNAQQIGNKSARLLKFTIPASEKRSAMRDLERMNITEASLFETQDAAARTLFRRTLQWFDDQ